jgi:small subunit ribosomal protein S4e
MARGPKKHLKRVDAPRGWLLSKLGGTWAPRPSTGPHKLRECLPVSLALRNRLKYALTRREVSMIVMRRLVEIDGKVRTDINYPTGFQDVLRLSKTNEQFRLLYDVKGKYVLHRIQPEEAQYKLLRVQKYSTGKKATIGRNPFLAGQAGVIPYVVTHDGRTIKYPSPDVKQHDTVKFDLKTNKIVGHLKFDIGKLAMVTRGANIGRVGTITNKEKHPGSFDIVHLRDKRGNEFATRIGNVFVIG